MVIVVRNDKRVEQICVVCFIFKIFSPIPTPRSRPVTPTLSNDDVPTSRPFAILPSYRPVTIDRQPAFMYDRPSSPCASPLIRQRSLEQISQSETSPQRSSEDDALFSSEVHSSGVHSAGDASDDQVN